jgi:CRISPR/Cas system-associated endonuclease Cas1
MEPTTPVNAILNHAYAALESELRITAISDGYGATIGIMHEGSDGSSKFIFDLMEPECEWRSNSPHL